MLLGKRIPLLLFTILVFAWGSLAGSAGEAEVESAAAPPAAPPPTRPEVYKISLGDTLAIIVWGEERFTQDCQVNGSGTISYPILGDVPVAGLTCQELQLRLQERLSKYLKRPQVIITVRQYGVVGMSVFVLGEVRTPGVYPLASGSGILQALAAAGGPTGLAGGEVSLVKARGGDIKTFGLEEVLAGGQIAPDAMPEPGDVLLVNRKAKAQETGRYAVLGEVPKPGMFDLPVEGEVRVLDAMQNAGLLDKDATAARMEGGAAPETERSAADLEHALLTRGEVVVPLDLAALLRGDTSQNLLLQSGDALTIPRRALTEVYALGEIHTPGRQLLPANSTVLDLLNAVKGASTTAKLSGAVILRMVDGKPTALPVDLGRLLQRADIKQNLVLQQGDVLCVPGKNESRRELWSFLPLIPYLRGF